MGNTGATRIIKAPKTLDVMVVRIVTRFRTVDEFVSAFRRFCGETTCFIPSAQAKRVGIETGFSIRLADGTPMLRGLCVVLDSWETADNPYERPGVRLGIRGLTAESRPVFQRLQLAGATANPELQEQAANVGVDIDLVFRGEPRGPHADLVLPANPLTDMSDESLGAFVDCTIFEDAIPELLETSNPRGASLERALAAAANLAVRLEGGTQRIERVGSPLDRARELADEHASSAFGAMFAQAAERIVPVADHTVPMTMPPEMLDASLSEETETVAASAVPAGSASSVRRPTLLGIVAVNPRRRR